MFFQVGVLECRHAAGYERVAYLEDDKASALAGVEDGSAIPEPAGLGADIADDAALHVEDLDLANGVCDFLSVRADVLHWCAADGAGDPAETFDASAIARDRVRNELVPVFA